MKGRTPPTVRTFAEQVEAADQKLNNWVHHYRTEQLRRDLIRLEALEDENKGLRWSRTVFEEEVERLKKDHLQLIGELREHYDRDLQELRLAAARRITEDNNEEE